MAVLDRKPFVCLPIAGQSFWQPGQPDARRTALREAAYIRRTKFEKGEMVHDFACRAEDLFMLSTIVPDAAAEWTRRPFLRWHLADEAAERLPDRAAVRAWHICADLPQGMSRGRWMDEAEAIVRETLPDRAVAEICGHLPTDHPPHVHILVAARVPGAGHYGRPLAGLEEALCGNLRSRWLAWLGEPGAIHRTRMLLEAA